MRVGGSSGRGWLARFRPLLVVGGVYLLAVALTAWHVVRPREVSNKYADSGMVTYLTAGKLLKNTRLRSEHLIRPSDLPLGYFWYLPKRTELVGMYLTADADPQAPVRLAAIRRWPSLDVPPKSRNISVALRDQPGAEWVNAGTVVDLFWAPDGDVVRGGTVQTIICRGEPAVCDAVISVDEVTGDKLAKAQSIRIVATALP